MFLDAFEQTGRPASEHPTDASPISGYQWQTIGTQKSFS